MQRQEQLKSRAAILEERRRCATDFAYFAEKYCKIRDKAGEPIPFRLNKVQRDLLAMINRQWEERQMVRIVVLKARQQGFSTFMQAYSYWYLKHRSTKQAFVVANLKKVSEALFGMLQYTHKQMPPQMRPKTSKGSVRQMVFADLDTSIEVDTAGAEDLGRGRTLNLAWLSEVAFWQESTAQRNLQSILVACPKKKNSIVIVESTANGVTGAYYDLYHRAPGNGFEQFFSPWFDSEDYTDESYPENFGEDRTTGELTIDEKQLMADHSLTLGQIFWRRGEIQRSETREDFMREYPAVPDEAFQNSGAPVFSTKALMTQANNAAEPAKHFYFDEEADALKDGTGSGELTVFEEPVKGQSYFIGADVSHGLGKGDYSVAQVLDTNRKQVAVFRSNSVGPRLYADVLCAIGKYYNMARIVIETNDRGFYSADRLHRDLRYWNVWTHIAKDKLTEQWTEKVGFDTNKKTKPQIIHQLADALRRGDITINCHETLSEMRTFIRTETDGLEASQGKHDDCVMSLAMCNHINTGPIKPIDSDLIEASFLPSY